MLSNPESIRRSAHARGIQNDGLFTPAESYVPPRSLSSAIDTTRRLDYKSSDQPTPLSLPPIFLSPPQGHIQKDSVNVQTFYLSPLSVRTPLPCIIPISKPHSTTDVGHARWSAHFLSFFLSSAPNDLALQKCDGGLPHCNRCVRTNRSPSCTYDLPLYPKRKTTVLQKGEACIPCRSVVYPFFCR